MIQELLTEKLRPKKFEHLVLSQRIKDALGNGILHQNVILFGSPGTGKTSAAKVLVNGYPFIYVNASDEGNIEMIRTKITNFCSTISVMDDMEGDRGSYVPIKYVILDEMDGGSDKFYEALRATIEKFAKNTRFIGTVNFINKIPDALRSRMENINFDFVNKEEEEEVRIEWTKRIEVLMNKLGIETTEVALNLFVDRNFPDMRSALNKIQSFHIQGLKVLTADKVKELNWSFIDLYTMIMKKPNPVETYKFVVSELSQKVDEAMDALGNEFIQWLETEHPDKINVIPHIIIANIDHQSKRNVVIDRVGCLVSLVYTIQMKIHA